ncbi:NF-kappa-B inhibitor zeta [Pristis pectinata]|uniref:NF-kappa-B inhibitor zeta n=1 Tax=Pristis pectinata TaxID=685728 RepID=UPI00223D4BFA|nr:NF-kappa-B inhibitor zeta [Pristis pectinata]
MILDRGSENSGDGCERENWLGSSPINLGSFYQSSPAASEPCSPASPPSEASSCSVPSPVACSGSEARGLKQPFQGVRVKNPVKDLLNHFRSTRSGTKLESHLPQSNSSEEPFSQIRRLLSGQKRSALENLTDVPPYKQSATLASSYPLTPPQTPNSENSDGVHKTESRNDVNPDVLEAIIKMLRNNTHEISLNTVQVNWTNVGKNDQVFEREGKLHNNSYMQEVRNCQLSPEQCQDFQQYPIHSPPQISGQREGLQPFPFLPSGLVPDFHPMASDFSDCPLAFPMHPNPSMSEEFSFPQVNHQTVSSQQSSEFYIPDCSSLQPSSQGDVSQPAPLYYPSQTQGKSFFQWQLEQEEKKLSHLTQEQLLSKDSDGDTLLHIAAAQGRRALAYVLGKKMAAVNMIDVKEHNGQSALQVAVAANQHLIVQDLVTLGAQVNTSDRWGRTPLHVVAEKGYFQVLVAIEKGMTQNCRHLNLEVTNFDGMTALHCAVLAQNRVVHELQSKIHQQPLSVETQELVMKKKSLLDTIKTLLQMGASIETRDRKSGRTPLHLAAEEANVELLRYFLEQPTSLNVVNAKAYNGNTALHVAAGMQDRVSQIDAVRLLMRKGADPSARNLENEQPVHLVPDGLRGEEVKRILKGKAAQSRMPLF